MTARKLHETLSPLERWLKQVGFSKGDPFGVNEADREPFVPECFIDPGIYDELKEEAHSVLVFAPRGSGKSALRVMLAADCRPVDLNSQTLAVSYTDFTPALEECNYNLEQLTAMDHVTQVLKESCKALLDTLMTDSKLVEGFSPQDRTLFSSYCQQLNPALLGTQAAYSHLKQAYLNTQPVEDRPQFEALISWPDLRQAVRQKHLGTLLHKLPFACSALDLYASLVDEAPEHLISQDSPKKLLEGFTNIAKRTGLQSVYILVDRLDEQLQTSQNMEKLAALVAPLVANLPLMELPDIAFKLFLPLEAQEAVMRFVRSERIQVLQVNWNDERLKNLLTLRLNVYSNDKVQSLGKLCVDALATNIEAEMVEVADGSPRRLLQLGAALLKAHVRISKGKGRITEKAWRQALDDVLGTHYVRPLQVDRKTAQVYVGRMTPVRLSPKLYRLVLYLYEQAGFRANTEILKAVWGDEYYPDETLRQAVTRVRKGLKDAGVDPDLYIINEPGKGYKLQNTA